MPDNNGSQSRPQLTIVQHKRLDNHMEYSGFLVVAFGVRAEVRVWGVTLEEAIASLDTLSAALRASAGKIIPVKGGVL